MTQHRDRFRGLGACGSIPPLRPSQTPSTGDCCESAPSNPAASMDLPGPEVSLCDFQRMRFCERRMAALLRAYGGEAAFHDDYLRLARVRQEAADKIAMEHIEIVYSLYEMVAACKHSRDGLLNEGLRALAKAIDTFEPSRGFDFVNYASLLIRRAFYRHLRRNSRPRYQEDSPVESFTCSASDYVRLESSLSVKDALR